MKERESVDVCHVGGPDHPEPNFGCPCVTGYNYPLDRYTTNCWFCGKDLQDEFTAAA